MRCLIIVLSLLTGCIEMKDQTPKYIVVGGEMMCFYGEQLRKCSYSSINKINELGIKPSNL